MFSVNLISIVVYVMIYLNVIVLIVEIIIEIGLFKQFIIPRNMLLSFFS